MSKDQCFSGTNNVWCTIRLPLIFQPKLTHPAARFVTDSWLTRVCNESFLMITGFIGRRWVAYASLVLLCICYVTGATQESRITPLYEKIYDSAAKTGGCRQHAFSGNDGQATASDGSANCLRRFIQIFIHHDPTATDFARDAFIYCFNRKRRIRRTVLLFESTMICSNNDR